MTRIATSIAAVAFCLSFVACAVDGSIDGHDEAVVAGDDTLNPWVGNGAEAMVNDEYDFIDNDGVTPHVGEITLTPGAEVVRSLTTGDTDRFRFATQPGMKYDVIISPVSGNPDLYTHLDYYISPTFNDCAPKLDEDELEHCPADAGTTGEYYAVVEAASDTVFVALVVETDTTCQTMGGTPVCSDLCPCAFEEGSCAADDQCSKGLTCQGSLCTY